MSTLYPIRANLAHVNENAIREYLEMLFFGVEWQPGQYACIRGIGEKGTDKEAHHREDIFIEPANQDLTAHVANHANRWAQWHVATFIVPAVLKADRGTAENVVLFTNAVVDLDSGNTDERLAWIVEHIGDPTMIVGSGGVADEGAPKRHVYFGFTEPTADIGAIVRLRDMLARKAGGCLSMGLGVDGNPYGRAHQPIRVAGTCHAKDGNARACSILAAGGWRYGL